MKPKTLLAISITRDNPALPVQIAAAHAAGADIVELRADCLRDIDAVEAVLLGPRAIPLILTIRTSSEGGQWAGHEDARIALFKRLGSCRPDYVDVEYAAWSDSAQLRDVITKLRSAKASPASPNIRLILSTHDFAATPRDVEAAAAPLLDSDANVIKLVYTPRDATDAWRILDFLRRHAAKRPIIALGMGVAGVLTRVLAPKFGGVLAFAALEPGAESAPGQPTVAELTDMYHWRALRPDTGVWGVIGWPVAHSRSPLIHNAAMRAARIAGVFVPTPVAPDYADLAHFLDYHTLRPELGTRGFSVTLPHKEHVLRWLAERGDEISATAQRAGAVNTLIRTGPNNWTGDNTDVAGIFAALRACVGADLASLHNLHAAVLGAGGVARAAIIGLQQLHVSATIFNRTQSRAKQLAAELGCAWAPWEQRADFAGGLVVNCTSVGMTPHEDATPFPDAALRPEMIVLDTVYTPPITKLLAAAQRKGCRIANGTEMFLGQAERQFELWHGAAPPNNAMRSALTGVAH